MYSRQIIWKRRLCVKYFLMGLTHDIGKILLLKAFSEISTGESLSIDTIEANLQEAHIGLGSMLLNSIFRVLFSIPDFNISYTEIQNYKFQVPNFKWFDKPFDRLTVLSKVEGLTTLSQSKGKFQFSMTKTFGILVISLS